MDAPDNTATTDTQVLGCNDTQRFILELEFIQCLGNPNYLNWLAQNKYFEDDKFLNYLGYLQYWKQPTYAKYLRYPHCLYFLDLLGSKDFRTAVANNTVAEWIHCQQFYFWQHYRGNRVKEALSQPNNPAIDSVQQA